MGAAGPDPGGEGVGGGVCHGNGSTGSTGVRADGGGAASAALPGWVQEAHERAAQAGQLKAVELEALLPPQLAHRHCQRGVLAPSGPAQPRHAGGLG